MTKSIPKFKTIREEAGFWDDHSFADYWDSERKVDVVYEPTTERKESMTLRIAPSLKRTVEDIAKEYDISTSSLIRMWIVDKVRDRRGKYTTRGAS